MINILIVEDNAKDMDYCLKLLENHNYNLKTYTATSSLEALSLLIENNIDGGIFNIHGPGSNDLELPFMVRSISRLHFLPLVFISNTISDILDIYRKYYPCGYIQKPYSISEFNSVIIPFLEGINAQKCSNISKVCLHLPNQDVMIPIDDILYIETVNRTPNIVTFNNVFQVQNKNLSQIIKKIGNEKFVQCHRKCYANIHKIHSIYHITYKSSDILFTINGDIKCPLSYTYKSNFLKKFQRV